MRLIAAAGSADMQAALSHPYVKTIVTTLLQLQDRNFFRLVTQFLKQNEQGNTTTAVARKIELCDTMSP